MAENDGDGGGGFQRPPSTFAGDRGGEAEDAELLALLRGISNKASGSRFADEDDTMTNDNDDNDNNHDENVGKESDDQQDGSDDALAEEGSVADDPKVTVDDSANVKSAEETTIMPEETRTNNEQADTTATPTEEGIDMGGGGEGGFQSSNLPNTFIGNRGGSAEDADLLAELRAISNKSSSSNRFTNGNGEDGNAEVAFPTAVGEEKIEEKRVVLPPLGGTKKKDSDEKSRPLPPWKQKGAKKKSAMNDDLDIVVAAPPAAPAAAAAMNPFQNALLSGDEEAEANGNVTQETSASSQDIGNTGTDTDSLIHDGEEADGNSAVKESTDENMGINSNLPKTCVGDRGGAAEDADLLAELRAISNKSSSSNRFDDGNDDMSAPSSQEGKVSTDEKKVDDVVAQTKPKEEKQTRPLPPWKQKGTKKKKASMNDAMDVVIAAPAAATLPATVSPFQNTIIDEGVKNEEAATESTMQEPMEENMGIKSNGPNTFVGDRGGDAEDADLLAELRAISSKSSTDRFAGGDDNDDSSTPITNNGGKASADEEVVDDKPVASSKPNSPKATREKQPRALPPWKQKGAKKKKSAMSDEVDVVIAAPASAPATVTPFQSAMIDEDVGKGDAETLGESKPTEENMGIKSSLPNTVNGDRGGAAEDEDLLAELRAISNKSSTDRFAGDDNDEMSASLAQEPKAPTDKPQLEISAKATKDKQPRPLPPWKQKGARKKKAAAMNDDMDVVIAAPAAAPPVDQFQSAIIDEDIGEGNADASGASNEEVAKVEEQMEEKTGIQSNLPSTFKGDRGGAAEDADLLAELRAISMKSSTDRFAGDNNDDNEGNVSTDDKEADEVITQPKPKSSAKATKEKQARPLPPWKQKGKKKAAAINDGMDVVIAAPTVAPPVDPFQNAMVDETAEKDNDDEVTISMSVEEPRRDNTGIKSNLPNTVIGDRGGSAEDADLLAELRGISMKSSTDRFAGNDEENNSASVSNDDNTAPTEKKEINSSKSTVASRKAEKSKRPLPPWKRKGAKIAAANDLDVVITAPPAPSQAVEFDGAKNDSYYADAPINDDTISMGAENDAGVANEPMEENMGIKSNMLNTVKGDRGGSAEDADLLAELRAISMKSSTDRFAGEEDEASSDAHQMGKLNSSVQEQPLRKLNHVKKNDASLPPWKRKNTKKKSLASDNVEVVVAAPPASSEAEVDEDEAFFPNATLPGSDVVAAAVEEASPQGIKSNLPNTVKGDRGGSAEDADLLAELRAISMKTSSNRFDEGENEAAGTAAILTDENENTNKSNNSVTEKPWKKSSKAKSKGDKSSRPLPPWKQKKGVKSTTNDVDMDIVIAAPSALPPAEGSSNADGVVADEAVADYMSDSPQNENMGIKSNLPNTVKGDRGGSAEDADLLAELRAISTKSSTDRFAGEEDENAPTEKDDVATKSTVASNKAEKASRPLPPWKRKGANKKAVPNDSVDVMVASPPSTSSNDQMNSGEASSSPGIKFNFSNTVKGDRGGSAEDADLLAELRAISMKSATNRFAGEEDEAGTVPSHDKSPGATNSNSRSNRPSNESKSQEINQNRASSAPSPAVQQGAVSSTQGSGSMGVGGMAPFPPSNADAEEIRISPEDLDESLKSSKWQVRKASYIFLHERLTSLLPDSDPMNQLNGADVYPSLDQTIPQALKDKNAGALDAALTLSILYVDSCQGACSDNTASQIMTSLLKGAAFSSSRSATLSSTEELVLKLIEVAPEGSSSINAVFELIQEHGLKSRKPKVLSFSAKLILKSVHTFGAGVLPMSTLKVSSESLIAHSNGQVREIGIQLLAEMCRTLGSKDPLQSLVDKLKKAQLSQLDSLIDAQPSATIPSRRLRCKMGEPASTQSPEEALAALKKSQEEDEARRIAARPAINLFQVLPQTCYSTKIKLDKWSEKVAALDALLDAGGELPYKLCPPSGSVSYTALTSQLKQLLSHTHFAVCSKALTALGMLAEGVGVGLLGNMRPLLPTLVALFKDKKVIKAVGSCLDKLFANVFSFEQLLDSKDSLPSSLDEKKQKNALVRKNILEYLVRCVRASGTYGTRGQLTIQYAEDLSKLACEKLKDSDATTRKAATEVLLSLLNSKEESIVSATKEITSSLQSTNPRAFKSLQLASSGGDKAPARPQSAPAKTSAKPSRREPSSKRPNNVAKSTPKNPGLPKLPAGPSASEDIAADKSLPSFEDSVENLSALAIPKWGDDIDDGGLLHGIQSTNWKARMGALNQLAVFYKTFDGERAFETIPSLFVLVRDSTKSFKESNFNVARALLELFSVIFGVYSQLIRAPDSYLYLPATKFAVDKIGDRKLSNSSLVCLYSICTVKDPHRVLAVAVKTIGDVKSPLVHEALLGWFNQFCIDFGAASLSNGISDCLAWVLKECDSNNMKVRKAALNVIGVMHSQLGPVLQAFIKSKDIQTSTVSLLGKVISDNPHDTNAQSTERKMKCITLSASNGSSHQGSSRTNASSILSIPSTDLVASLKSDCISRIGETEGKAAWKIRRDAMEEVRVSVDKCGGLITTEGKSMVSFKQLLSALRSRLNDSQSNLKPAAATLIGSLLNHVDDGSQAKLGKVVYSALANAAMNDMKKTMRDAAVSALLMGTELPKQNGGGTNLLATESFIVCLESELSDAALKSSGLERVLSFLTERLESFFSIKKTGSSNTISVSRQLAKVVVLSLLSSKSGTRSAAEKLLSICKKNGVVLSEDLDTEIGRLLPAQQRSVRSIIPKLSIQEQELVETFQRPPPRSRQSVRPSSARQPVRPGSSSRQPVRRVVTAAPTTSEAPASQTYNDANPLHPITSKSTKSQRMALFGRSDHWPEYPEEPSNDDTLQTLRKSWSLLISPSSISILFPKGGIHSHEDSIRGCEIISQSINYSRSSDDVSFLDQSDLIFKWIACALSSRDHTSGLRSILSMLLLLFQRLNELSYVMNDAEATILLPCILEKAGVGKSQFKEQFMDILSFIRSKELYQLQRYGSTICMKVVEKSKSIGARSLAASECSSCVKAAGVGAIGKKGVQTLSKALNQEKLPDIRKAYLDLFFNVVQSSTLEKVLFIVGDSVTDKTKDLIIDRCSKRPATAPAPTGGRAMHHNDPKQSRLRTPSRKSVPLANSVSPRASLEGPDRPTSSTSAVTGALMSRLQRSRDERQTSEGSLLTTPHGARQGIPLIPPNKVEHADLYIDVLNDISGMINGTFTKDKGVQALEAIRKLGLAVKNDANGSLSGLRQNIGSDLDQFVETLSSALKYSFEHCGVDATLRDTLIRETVQVLTYVFLTPQYCSALSNKSLACLLGESVSALVDGRIDASAGGKDTTKRINKLAMRAAVASPRETSLLALLSLQESTVSSTDINQPATASKVLWKLFNKIMKDEHEKNPTNPLGDVTLDSLLYSLDFLLSTVEDVRSRKPGSEELLKYAEATSKDVMVELVKCQGKAVREALEQSELSDGDLVGKLLGKCEHEMGLRTHPPQSATASLDGSEMGQSSRLVESTNMRLAELIQNWAGQDGPKKQVALLNLVEFKKSNNLDLEAHLLQQDYLSPPTMCRLLDQIGKATKENYIGDVRDPENCMNERVKALNLRLKVGRDQTDGVPVTEQASSLRERLEALRHSTS